MAAGEGNEVKIRDTAIKLTKNTEVIKLITTKMMAIKATITSEKGRQEEVIINQEEASFRIAETMVMKAMEEEAIILNSTITTINSLRVGTIINHIMATTTKMNMMITEMNSIMSIMIKPRQEGMQRMIIRS